MITVTKPWTSPFKNNKNWIHCSIDTYNPEYMVNTSSGRQAVGPTAFSARQKTAWRFSLKPCSNNKKNVFNHSYIINA